MDDYTYQVWCSLKHARNEASEAGLEVAAEACDRAMRKLEKPSSDAWYRAALEGASVDRERLN